MRLGIFAKTFPGNRPEDVIQAVRSAGFACVQYNMACSGLASMPEEISEDDAAAVSSAAHEAGISVAAVSGTYNMIHPDRAVRDVGHRRLEVIASRCRLMGTGLVTLCTGTRDPHDQWRHHPDNDSLEAWRDLVTSMTVALDIAERHDIHLGIEPELANVVNSAAKASRLLADMKSTRLRIVLDAANLFEAESLDGQRRIVSDASERLGGHIAMAHAKDRTAAGAFVAAGKGVLDYRHYLSALRRAGYDGPIVTHGLEASEAPSVAAFLTRALTEALA